MPENPKAIINHCDPNSKKYIIWDFEETLEYNNEGCFFNAQKIKGDPLDLWQQIVDKWKSESLSELAYVGFFSYDFKNHLFPHIPFKKRESAFPFYFFAKPKAVTQCNNFNNFNTIYDIELNLIKDIPDKLQYKNNVATIKNFLKNGDVYQINYTNPKYYNIQGNPFNFFINVCKTENPYYGYYINTGNHQVLSFSPERFFKVSNRKIESHPMKGTANRSNNPIEDNNYKNQLSLSTKDRAEHLMIVDLMRNDLGKICDYNSIHVKNLFNILSFETVHQMVSEVHGLLRPEIVERDVIQALFPGGSITGAPKERAMQIIDEIELYPRECYTGSIGYGLSNGDMDFNIAIRTMTQHNNIYKYCVGGGIVWDSNFYLEWLEAHQKSLVLDQFINNEEKVEKV